MLLKPLDWAIFIAFLLLSLVVGLYARKKSGQNTGEFFAGGGNMPWWLLGVSMVATTFATDTPNLVTNIVRQDGISGNWVWWSFLLTGLLTVFFYARLWKRSGVLTDIEFYELRYSGKTAAFLRGFRALYLGVFFNVLIIASVSLAAIKIGGVLLGISPLYTLLIAGLVTVIYSSLGGLRGVVLTDNIQFVISIGGAIAAAVVALQHPQVGGLANLIQHEAVASKLAILPDISQTEVFITLFFVPLFIQWWSVWYPGAEPGGGGYVVQRMLAAKNERHALGSVLFFNLMHYAVRPWPWIIVALCSIVVFPDLDSMRAAFPNSADIVENDMAYPAMLSFLPVGLMGLVVTSLAAAYMSTLSTHLNWGASYVVNDFYKRFIKPSSSEKELVQIGRLATLIIMILGGSIALLLESALQGFQILLQIGAGTGLIFILRWYWWRINAASEITAMVVSFVVACYFAFLHQRLGFEPVAAWQELIWGVGITTVSWLIVAFTTQVTNEKTLIHFAKITNVRGIGWKHIVAQFPENQTMQKANYQYALGGMIAAGIGIYALLAGIGQVLFSHWNSAGMLLLITTVCSLLLYRWREKF